MSLGPLEILKDVTERFEKLKIEYFLVGSLASMYYSRPRFTNDIDLVVAINPAEIKNFDLYFPLQEYYCPPFEVIRDEVTRMGSFNLIHQETGIKIDLVLTKNTEHSKSEFSRRKKVFILPVFEAFIASPEDIIIKKLEFYRSGGSEKHLLDVKDMVAEVENLDYQYLNSWLSNLSLEKIWQKV